MIPVSQKQLDTFRTVVWNAHRIQTQKDTLLPDGVPDHIHDFPEEYGLQECGKCNEKLIKQQDRNGDASKLFVTNSKQSGKLLFRALTLHGQL